MPSAPRWQRERPEIRASDAERERIVTFLRDKAAEGRLSPDELDERVGRAYVAMTRGELRRLVRDLPDPPFRAGLERSRRRPAGVAVLGLTGLAALRLPGLALLLVWSALAVTVALMAVIVMVAVALGPIIALFVLFALAMRRRAGALSARGYRPRA
jgi:hypothetical protein